MAHGKVRRVFFTADEVVQFEPDFVNAIMPGKIGEEAVVAVPVQIDLEKLKPPITTMNARAVLIYLLATTGGCRRHWYGVQLVALA